MSAPAPHAATIRPARPDDYEPLLSLWLACDLPVRPRGRESPEAFARQLASPVCRLFVAEADGRLVGAVLASHDARKGWVNRLAVHPAWRKRGLGAALIRACEAFFAESGVAIYAALIEADNTPSRRLFEKLGYEWYDDVLYYRKAVNPDV